MARARQNNSLTSNPPPPIQNWWDTFLVKIGSTGGAVIVLITVAGAFFEAGRRYMENEKNIEIFDLKTEQRQKIDSLIIKHTEELKNLSDKSKNKNGK